MPILTDFHTHSSFSGDCNTPMEHMIEQAIKLGMSHLCITEHFDPDYPVRNGENLDFSLDAEAYRKKYLECKEKYVSKITLLWGVELGLQTQVYPLLKEFVHNNPFDFIIASSHLCNGGDPYYPDFFENKK